MADKPVPYRPGMILMPGQSTSISVPLPPEIAEAMSRAPEVEWTFTEVPPPAKALVQSLAKELGLPDGLSVDVSRAGGWRCANCGRMQKGGAALVWVPDSVSVYDPLWSVVDAGRRNAFNGSRSGWCLHCAKRLGSPLTSITGAPWFPIAIIGAAALLLALFLSAA